MRLFQWKCLLSHERFPHGYKIRIIDREDMNRSSPNSRSAHKYSSSPLEVPIPLVRSRMEESNKLARIRIYSGYVRTFVAVAVQAGEGEILKNSEPSMLEGNDVIDVKKGKG